MPNRIIKESICYSDDIDVLTWFEEVVFYRLLVRADDNGRLDARLPYLCSLLFATRDGITCTMLEDALVHLNQLDMIYRYAVDNRPYLLISKWLQHQRVRHVRGKYPMPAFDLHSEEGQKAAADFTKLTGQSVPSDLPSTSDLPSASDCDSDKDKDLDLDKDTDRDKDIGGKSRRVAASKQAHPKDDHLLIMQYMRKMERAQLLGEPAPTPLGNLT